MVKFSQLCTEYFIDFPTLPEWSVTESHHIWFDLYPALTHEHLTLSLPSFSPRQSKLCLTHPTTSPSLHFPSEEFQTTHFSPPSVEFNPPCFPVSSHILVFQLCSGFLLLLFVAHAGLLMLPAFFGGIPTHE